ncbi:hypothetical protein VitviT2T_004571 [Vitis vinifera]|uniref:K Homology domain-containing protein n=2 Tax=Vitis vinifera TaxID=29760 RepID=A0ABY9BRG4_VITVI|nr:RNA-binding KH domain-containing protein PEPPER [Vitis vinifera]XP_059592156.1 RNA-binding KH domain-containing protein PEPPER [Vitis vinifera]WJZ85001.1 hypothetical protein VitviT2T_004571 [Vitis vinifera]|eukprot:XP_019074707.1 PREDICTED: RNA-binding KH domain-containing protein PEPPER-like [Vitis vinifera]
MASVDPTAASASGRKPAEKWPGWPGQNAFRLIVPGSAVGSIIGREGKIIKRISEGTGARIHVISLPAGTTDCIVLISAKEQPHLRLSPAMEAVIEVFKRVTGLYPIDGNGMCSKASEVKLSSVTFLVGYSQALSIIGKEGSRVRAIEESSGTTVGILSRGCAGVPFYVSPDERIIKIQGQVLKVMAAMEAVLYHLRLYLVDSSVIPAFSEKCKTGISQADQSLSLHHSTPAHQPGADSMYSLPLLGHEAKVEAKIPSSYSSLYAQEPVLGGLPLRRSDRAAAPAQRTERIKIPFSAAKDIIGIAGETIDHIRRTSGSIITIEEDRSLPDEYILEVRGTTSQLQTAQQLIEELLESHHQPGREGSIYDNMDAGLSSNSQFALPTHPLSPFSPQYRFPSQPSGENGISSAGEHTGSRFWKGDQISE